MKVSKATSKSKKVGKPKKTRQGMSVNTKLSGTPSNRRKKKYRGQGR